MMGDPMVYDDVYCNQIALCMLWVAPLYVPSTWMVHYRSPLLRCDCCHQHLLHIRSLVLYWYRICFFRVVFFTCPWRVYCWW